MDFIFNTRKELFSESEQTSYYELLKGLERNNESTHKVVFINDDKTPMYFVSLLYLCFHDINTKEAEKRMMNVHEKGSGELLRASKELAEKTMIFISNNAENNGHPLQVEVHDI